MIRTFKLTDGDFIGHTLLALRLADLFRVLPALDTAQMRILVPTPNPEAYLALRPQAMHGI